MCLERPCTLGTCTRRRCRGCDGCSRREGAPDASTIRPDLDDQRFWSRRLRMLHRDLERSSYLHAIRVVLLRLFVRRLNIVLVRGNGPAGRNENGIAVQLLLIEIGDVFRRHRAVIALIRSEGKIAAMVGKLDDVAFDSLLAPVITSDADDLL